jgi:hypothetical protein
MPESNNGVLACGLTATRDTAGEPCHDQRMTDIPEGGRQAAHVILDAISAWDTAATPDANAAAMNLALKRMNDVDAVKATLDDNENLSLDASNLLGGAMVSVNWLIEQLAHERRSDKRLVISELRDFLDQ